VLNFEEVLEKVSELSIEQQEVLVQIIERRISDRRRKDLAAESWAALEEFRMNKLKPMTAAEAIEVVEKIFSSPE
jgi:hypothetical protein